MTVLVTCAFVLLFAVLWACERRFPLRILLRPKLGRMAVNAAMSVLAFAAAITIVRPAVMSAFGWSSGGRCGILSTLPEWFGLQLVAGFLLLDLTFYLWHRANHQLLCLWRFHNVHHLDPDLDVSTSFRFHFGEIALSAVFQVLQVLVIGPPFVVFAIYEIGFHANTLFQHSNIRLPIAFERLLNIVVVTPRMHGIHHSSYREENHSNFSVVLPWWDALLGTLRLNVPQSEIVVGVPGYSDEGSQSLFGSMTAPFRTQREYWKAGERAMFERPGTRPKPRWLLVE